MVVFILEDALSVWTNLGKHLLFVWLFVSSIKTGTRRIIRLDKLFSVVRRSRRTTEDNSSRRIMRLVPVFILETNNQTNNKYLPKFVQTDNASSSIKTANKATSAKGKSSKKRLVYSKSMTTITFKLNYILIKLFLN